MIKLDLSKTLSLFLCDRNVYPQYTTSMDCVLGAWVKLWGENIPSKLLFSLLYEVLKVTKIFSVMHQIHDNELRAQTIEPLA